MIALLVLAAALILPTALAGVGVNDPPAFQMYAEPGDIEAYDDAVGYDITMVATEAREPWEYVGWPRSLHLHLDIGVYLAHGLPEVGYWNVYLPYGTQRVRQLNPETGTFAEWRAVELDVTDPTSEAVMIRLDPIYSAMTAATDDIYVNMTFELELAPPVTRRYFDNWEWHESWTLVWDPQISTSDGEFPTWRAVDLGSAHDGPGYSTFTEALQAADVLARPGVFRASICSSCEVSRFYGDLSEVASGELAHALLPTGRGSLDWDTPWYPWRWIVVLVGLAVTALVVEAIVRLARGKAP